MKKLTMALLINLVCLSVVGCGETKCTMTAAGDEVCVFSNYNEGKEIRVYKNGKLDDYFGSPAVQISKFFEGFGYAERFENYKDGKKHDACGPAVIDFDGTREWWIEGVMYSKEEFSEKTKFLCKINKPKDPPHKEVKSRGYFDYKPSQDSVKSPGTFDYAHPKDSVKSPGTFNYGPPPEPIFGAPYESGDPIFGKRN